MQTTLLSDVIRHKIPVELRTAPYLFLFSRTKISKRQNTLTIAYAKKKKPLLYSLKLFRRREIYWSVNLFTIV